MKKMILAVILVSMALTANAAPIVLTFEGLQNYESIGGFYSGGAGSLGSSGPNLGITFSTNTLAIIDADAGGSGNFGGEPSPSTIMFFLEGDSAIMNVLAGFDTGFSFFYSAINNPGSVNVYDNFDGIGNILASLDIPTTLSDGGDPNGNFSPFFGIGVGFSGIAKSVSFAGVQDQIGFDDITFGSVTPGGVVPEPSTALLLGIGLIGTALAGRRMRRA